MHRAIGARWEGGGASNCPPPHTFGRHAPTRTSVHCTQRFIGRGVLLAPPPSHPAPIAKHRRCRESPSLDPPRDEDVRLPHLRPRPVARPDERAAIGAEL